MALHPTRLIKITESKCEDGIKLHLIDNTTVVPPYVAISHIWNPGLNDQKIPNLELFLDFIEAVSTENYTTKINAALVHSDNYGVTKGLKFVAKKVLDLGYYRMKQGSLTDETLWDEQVYYFWVDAICINQKDDTDKSKDLLHMNTIYKNSKSVICLMQPISDIYLLDSEYLRTFRWFYRIWTYQELYLNEHIWFLDKSVTCEKWNEILYTKCNKEEMHCKNMTANEKHAHLKEYLEHISFGFINSSIIPLIEKGTYISTVLPLIEDKNNPVSLLPELNNYLTDTRSLPKLMYYTRHRTSKYDEDKIIGVLGLLDVYIDAVNLYGNGIIYTLNKILNSMLTEDRTEHALQFLICRWYSEERQCVNILDMLLPSNEQSYTGLLTCKFTYCNRDVEVLEFTSLHVCINVELIHGKYLGCECSINEYEPYNIRVATEHNNNITCRGKVDMYLHNTSNVYICLVRIVSCIDYFSDDKCEDVWCICTAEKNIHKKRGIALIEHGLLMGTKTHINLT